MVSDTAKFFVLTTFLVLCVLIADAGPCFSRTGEPAPVIHLAAGPERHVIKAGETINLLALRYGVPAAAILKANPGLNPSRLQLGREILIPAPGRAVSESSAAPAAAAAPTIELRPEKAPQATQVTQPKEHDLPDAVGKTPVNPPVAAEKTPAAPAALTDGGKGPGNSGKSPVSESRRPAIDEIWPMQSPTPSTGTAAASPQSLPEAKGFFHGAAAWFLAILIAVALIVGLALQGILSSFAAGCALRVLHLFTVGDEVMLAGIVGKVEALGRFYVVIRSEAEETVLVPNAKAISEIMVVAAPGTAKETPGAAGDKQG